MKNDMYGIPTKDMLKKLAKKHAKTNTKGSMGTFMRFTGNPEREAEIFNHAMGSDVGGGESTAVAVSESVFDGGWELVDRKTVRDTDGFWTDYSWYKHKDGDIFIHRFCLGDSDLYDDPDEDYDFETEDEDTAKEWFDSYDEIEEE